MKTKQGFWCSRGTWMVTALTLSAAASAAPGCSDAFTCSDKRNCKPTAHGGMDGAGQGPLAGAAGAEQGEGGTFPTGASGGTAGAGGAPLSGQGGTSPTSTGGAPPTAGDASLDGGDGPIATGGTSAGGAHSGGMSAGGTHTGGTSAGGAASGGASSACAHPASGPPQCTAQCPCKVGEGQCTSAAGCETGLVCAVNTGRKFGFSGNTCVPKHCDDDLLNADESSVDCGGECGCLAEFMRLGFLSNINQSSWAADVSSDGSVVVGTSVDSLYAYINGEGVPVSVDRAFRWVKGAGLQRLPDDIAPPDYRSVGMAVSGDGSVVAGNVEGSGPQNPSQAFTWSKATGSVKLGAVWTYTRGLSVNGKVAVGGSRGNRAEAWGAGAASVTGPGQTAWADAVDTNEDGSVIVGSALDDVNVVRAVVWRQDGAHFLEAPTGPAPGLAAAVTPDGLVIVGAADIPGGSAGATIHRAMLWTQKAGSSSAFGLDDLPGGKDNSEAVDVSGDGKLVVGWGTTANGTEALIWDRVSGTRRLVDELIARGIEWPNSWSINTVTAISTDGTTVVGAFMNPEGHREAWRIVLR